MKLLSSKQELNDCLFDIIQNSQDVLKIVSPFVDFWGNRLNQGKWSDMINELNQKKNILEIYTKKEAIGKIEEKIKINKNSITIIDNLHAKMYINDDTALLSSMNLSFPAFQHSIDFGVITENKAEYNKVMEFFNKYIFIHSKSNREELKQSVVEYFKSKEISAEFDEWVYLILEKNNSYVRCSYDEYTTTYPDRIFIYFDITKDGKRYKNESFHNAGKDNNIEIKYSKNRKMYYISLSNNPIPYISLITAINGYRKQILDILTKIFNILDS